MISRMTSRTTLQIFKAMRARFHQIKRRFPIPKLQLETWRVFFYAGKKILSELAIFHTFHLQQFHLGSYRDNYRRQGSRYHPRLQSRICSDQRRQYEVHETLYCEYFVQPQRRDKRHLHPQRIEVL